VLISSHILDELSRLATHYGFIDKGTIVKEITAEELENTCRKCVKLQVTDTAVLAHILDKRGLEYEILSDTQANVYGELVVSDVALELAEQNCRMFSVQEYEESLESYYLNLWEVASMINYFVRDSIGFAKIRAHMPVLSFLPSIVSA